MTVLDEKQSDTVGAAPGAPNGPTTAPKPKPKAAAKAKMKQVKRTVTQSTISFPYRDMDSGVSVALAILGAGGVALTTEQLAGVMGLQAGSGNFVMKVATARIFGLISNAGGKYELTNSGFAIVDKDERRQKAARAEAFLHVPLYRRVYDEFRGKQLPPRPHALEQAFVRFGVSEKSKTAARQIFDKSAAQAGFFANGNDRLVEPIIAGGSGPTSRAPVEDGENNRRQEGGGSSKPSGAGYHHFIQGLLDTLPPPDTNWAPEGRKKWLEACNNIFDLLYKGAGEIDVTLKDPSPKNEKK